jgi:hypothetical protein
MIIRKGSESHIPTGSQKAPEPVAATNDGMTSLD